MRQEVVRGRLRLGKRSSEALKAETAGLAELELVETRRFPGFLRLSDGAL